MLTLLAAVWLSFGPPIQRPSAGVPLGWQAPRECPDRAVLRERVHALVPGLLDRRDGPGSRVDVEVRAGDEGYDATVIVRNSDGEIHRSFAALDCETIVDAAALILAVALDPVGVSEGLARSASSSEAKVRAIEPEPEPIEPGPEPDGPESIEPIEPDPDPEPIETDSNKLHLTVDDRDTPRNAPPRQRPDFGVRLLGGGGYGPTNTGYPTIAGTLALIGPRWRAELGALWAIPRVVRVDAELGGRFDSWAVLGRGCFAPKLRRLELPSCAGVELGSVRGAGLDTLPTSSSASFLWIAIAAAQGLWFAPIDRVAIGLELDLAVPLNRGEFGIDATEVQRTALLTVRGLAGLELRW